MWLRVCCLVQSALPAPNVTISFSGDSIAGLTYSLNCSASVVAGLVVLPHLKIVFPNSTEVSAVSSSSMDYVFSPLRTSDGGQYTCTATVNIPQAGITDLQNSVVETITVVGKYHDPILQCHVTNLGMSNYSCQSSGIISGRDSIINFSHLLLEASQYCC